MALIPSPSFTEHPKFKAFIDHVTLVCPAGGSEEVLNWYGKCFGMNRFLVNPTENIETGKVRSLMTETCLTKRL